MLNSNLQENIPVLYKNKYYNYHLLKDTKKLNISIINELYKTPNDRTLLFDDYELMTEYNTDLFVSYKSISKKKILFSVKDTLSLDNLSKEFIKLNRINSFFNTKLIILKKSSLKDNDYILKNINFIIMQLYNEYKEKDYIIKLATNSINGYEILRLNDETNYIKSDNIIYKKPPEQSISQINDKMNAKNIKRVIDTEKIIEELNRNCRF